MKLIHYFLVTAMLVIVVSCEGFLEEKPEANLKEADSLEDLDALINNTSIMNYYIMGLGEASSDNYYIDKEIWGFLEEHERQIYLWGDEIFYDFYLNSWLDYYQSIYYSNHVLQRLEKISTKLNSPSHTNELKGKALFFRSFGFYKLLTLFSKGYHKTESKTDMGIPMRLSDDFNVESNRGSVESCYLQIIADLELAVDLLPSRQVNSHLPSKQAVFVLLSWIHLSMQNFQDCEKYAKLALAIDGEIADYKNYTANDAYPFSGMEKEVVFTVGGGSFNLLYNFYAKVDTLLYASYDQYDRRKQLFFGENKDKTHYFKGSYLGANGLFMGLAVTDAYLNIAESLIRMNRSDEGLAYLNELMKKRYEEGYVPSLVDLSKDQALKLLVSERRKEFVFRDSRWGEIKRLNNIDRIAIVPRRQVGDLQAELKANDNRFALPLPAEIIDLTGMPQNPR